MSTHTKLICCQRSGVPLVEVTSVCSNGWALLSQPAFTCFLHPTYGLPLGKVLRKLELLLIDAAAAEWNVPDTLIREISICMSATTYTLGAMWMPTTEAISGGRNIEPSLPDQKITIGCADRLLQLGSWYHHETSKRITFPLWKPSKLAGNLNWHGFPAWLDACFEIREEWAKTVRGRAAKEELELINATEKAMATVHAASVYKRIDIKKVWNWVELQASQHSDRYAPGRRETLKELFYTGDECPEDWLPDDCDDLIEMILDTCDVGNDIVHFIRSRVTNIRRGISDFYSNFTMLGSVDSIGDGGLELSQTEQTAQTKLLGEYEAKLLTINLPSKAPAREAYPSVITWLRAQAEYNILSRVAASRANAVEKQNAS